MAIIYQKPPLSDREAELKHRMLAKRKEERWHTDKRVSKKNRNPTSKRCIGCELKLPIDRFYEHKPSADGHSSRCKDCIAEYQRSRAGILKLRRSLKWETPCTGKNI